MSISVPVNMQIDAGLDEERVSAINAAIVKGVEAYAKQEGIQLNGFEIFEGTLMNLCVMLQQIQDEGLRFTLYAHAMVFIGKNCGIETKRIQALYAARNPSPVVDTIGKTEGTA